MKEFDQQLPYEETSRITDTISLLQQALSFKDREQEEAFCARAAISLLFGADAISENMIIGKGTRDVMKEVTFIALEKYGLWVLPARTSSHFLEHMSQRETYGALIFTTVIKKHDHLIGIIPSTEDGKFLIVDTSKKPYVREVDELGLIDLFVNADIAFPQKSGKRGVFMFTKKNISKGELGLNAGGYKNM